jgi:hypothetical protein
MSRLLTAVFTSVSVVRAGRLMLVSEVNFVRFYKCSRFSCGMLRMRVVSCV